MATLDGLLSLVAFKHSAQLPLPLAQQVQHAFLGLGEGVSVQDLQLPFKLTPGHLGQEASWQLAHQAPQSEQLTIIVLHTWLASCMDMLLNMSSSSLLLSPTTLSTISASSTSPQAIVATTSMFTSYVIFLQPPPGDQAAKNLPNVVSQPIHLACLHHLLPHRQLDDACHPHALLWYILKWENLDNVLVSRFSIIYHISMSFVEDLTFLENVEAYSSKDCEQ